MLDMITRVLAVLLGLHALIKFAFFLLPYPKRRAALDKAYGERPSATERSDAVLLGIVIVLSGAVLWRGVEATSFLFGLWIGAALIELFFHRFHLPLAPEVAPPPTVSPLKMMSYAIQAAPGRAWREMAAMGALIAIAFVILGGGG